MLGDAWLDQLLEVGGQRVKRAFLVLAHHLRVARNIGDEDRGKAAFHSFFASVESALSRVSTPTQITTA